MSNLITVHRIAQGYKSAGVGMVDPTCDTIRTALSSYVGKADRVSVSDACAEVVRELGYRGVKATAQAVHYDRLKLVVGAISLEGAANVILWQWPVI